MIVAHLADLHLGYRALPGAGGGTNPRERDVERALRASLERLAELAPHVVVVSGDVFDRPAPGPRATSALAGWTRALREYVPGVRILLVAGVRDTPLDPGGYGALDVFPAGDGVDVVSREVRRIVVPAPGIDDAAFLCVPRRALLAGEPAVEPDPGAGANVLVLHAPPRPGAPGVGVDPGAWEYVALGGEHAARRLEGGRVQYAGALERTTGSPWEEAAEEKGFFTVGLPDGEPEFHPVQGRPVVELAAVDARSLDEAGVAEKIREVVEVVPGGIEGKLVRLPLRGLTPPIRDRLDPRLLDELRRRAFGFVLDVELVEGIPSGGNAPKLPASVAGTLSADEALAEETAGLEEEATARLRDALGEGGAWDPGSLDAGLSFRALVPGSGLADGGPAPELRVGPGLTAVAGGENASGPEWILSALLELRGGEDGSRGLRAGWRVGVEARGDEATAAPGDSFAAMAELTPATYAGLAGGVRPDGTRLAPGDAAEALLEVVAGTRIERAERNLEHRLREATRDLPAGKGDAVAAETAVGVLEVEADRLDELGEERRAISARIRGAERELRDLRADAAEVGGDLEARRMEWLRERQDAETHLQAYRDRARELKAQLTGLEDAGADAACPVCGHRLGEDRSAVAAELRDEWEDVVQDGQWWKRRREQLDDKPEEIRELEARLLRLNAAIEEGAQRLERERLLAARAEAGERELRRKTELLEGLRRGLGETPGDAPGSPGGEAPGLREALGAVRRVRRRLRDRALRLVTARAGRHLGRLTEGGYEGMAADPQGGMLLLRDNRRHRPAGAAAAAARVALHVALVELVLESGARPLGSMVVAGGLDPLRPGGRRAAIDLLSSVARRLGQVVVAERTDVVEVRPEPFHRLVLVRGSPEDGVSFDELRPAAMRIETRVPTG